MDAFTVETFQEYATYRDTYVSISVEDWENMYQRKHAYWFYIESMRGKVRMRVTRLRKKKDNRLYVYLENVIRKQLYGAMVCILMYIDHSWPRHHLGVRGYTIEASTREEVKVCTRVCEKIGTCYNKDICYEYDASLNYARCSMLTKIYEDYFSSWKIEFARDNIVAMYALSIMRMREWISVADNLNGCYLRWVPRDVRFIIVDMLLR